MTVNLVMPDRLLMGSEEFMLQMEMSAVTEGSVMGVSAEMEVETTGHPLMTSTTKRSACQVTSLPRMWKIIRVEKEPGPPQEATPQIGLWPSFPLFTV